MRVLALDYGSARCGCAVSDPTGVLATPIEPVLAPGTKPATLRRALFTVPGRLVHSARRRHLRLPQRWPWAEAFTAALAAITAIPMRC